MTDISSPNSPVNPHTDELESMRDKLKANGWHWLPGQGKGIYYDGWNKGEYDYDMAEYQALENPDWNNTGILCGTMIARDVDAKIPSTAAKLASARFLAESPCGTRYGSKGSAKFYRASAPMRSITVRGIAPGEAKKSTIVEYIGMTRQLMCFGVHPDTGKHYRWEGRSPLDFPATDIPVSGSDDLLAQANDDKAIALAEGWTEVTITLQATEADKKQARDGNGGLVDKAMLEKMLSHIDPGQDHLACLPVFGALKYAEACELLIESEFSAEEISKNWARGEYWHGGEPGNYAEGWAQVRWDSMDPFKKGGAKFGSLVHLARDGGYKGPTRIDGPFDRFLAEDDFTGVKEPVAIDESVPFEKLFDPWQESAARPFPLDTLPPVMRDYIGATAENIGGDVSAFAMSCLAALSGALTHESKLYLKAGKIFPVGPRLWVMLFGDPSWKKSPLMDTALAHVLSVDNKRDAGHHAKVRAIRDDESLSAADKAKAQTILKRETPPQLVAHDLTMEKLGEILSYQNSGILIYRDELAGWLGSMEKYGSKGGSAADRGFWLSSYGGKPYRMQRKAYDLPPIKNLSTSILGGFQPDKMKEFSGLEGDGLLQRFLPVMMRKPVMDSERFDPSLNAAWEGLLDRLMAYPATEYNLSPRARNEFRRINEALFTKSQNMAAPKGFRSFVGKLQGVWGSLALLMHVAWDGKVHNQISAETAQRASRIVEQFLIPHGLLFYMTMTETATADDRHIGACIYHHFTEGNAKISARVFQKRTGCCKILQADKVAAKVMAFVGGGWLTPVNDVPWCKEWTINPEVVGFAKQAAEHRREWQDMVRDMREHAAEKTKEDGIL